VARLAVPPHANVVGQVARVRLAFEGAAFGAQGFEDVVVRRV
jgi:hypothetical protein